MFEGGFVFCVWGGGGSVNGKIRTAGAPPNRHTPLPVTLRFCLCQNARTLLGSELKINCWYYSCSGCNGLNVKPTSTLGSDRGRVPVLKQG